MIAADPIHKNKVKGFVVELERCSGVVAVGVAAGCTRLRPEEIFHVAETIVGNFVGYYVVPGRIVLDAGEVV